MSNSEDFGEGVSLTLSAENRNFSDVIFQAGKPPLDSEFNLISQSTEEARKNILKSGIPSGWVSTESDPMRDFDFDRKASNLFYFGRNASEDDGGVVWANVNGWPIPVVGTNNSGTKNVIKLPPPQGSVSDSDVNFVFLEVWKAQLSPDGTDHKPAQNKIYKYGNVDFGGTNLDNDIEHPSVGKETTERVQLQYRIRVVQGVDPSTNPYGFNSNIKAQGPLGSPYSSTNPIYEYENMEDKLGDPGLWRAGDGDGETTPLNTVDGYVYAIPLCLVFRRTDGNWSNDSQHAAVNRFDSMTSRDQAKVLSDVELSSDIADDDTSISVSVAQSSTEFDSGGGLVQIGGEIIEYSSYSGSTITASTRGAKGTYATKHSSGDKIEFVSGHPEGLFSDQIVEDDVLDVRHNVNPQKDHSSLLNRSFNKLLKGDLQTSWKKSTADVKGKKHYQVDFMSSSGTPPNHTIKGDAPDGFRKIFSDACTLQPDNLVILDAGTTESTSDLSFNPSVNIYRRNSSQWHQNDVFEMGLSQFRSTFGGDKRVRFVHPFEYDNKSHDPMKMWFGEKGDSGANNLQNTVHVTTSTTTDPLFMAFGTVVSDLDTDSEGTDDIDFKANDLSGVGPDSENGEAIAISGQDFSVTQTGTIDTVGDYLANQDAWIVINGAGDATSTNPENHGAFKIVGNNGTDLVVQRADGSNPDFTTVTNNRDWSIRYNQCHEDDDDVVVAITGDDGGNVQLSTSTLNFTFDVLYHPVSGLSRVPDEALYVDLDTSTPSSYLRENDWKNPVSSTSADVKRSHTLPFGMFPHDKTNFQTRDLQTLQPEKAWAEAYVDRGSKTLLYQPVRNISVNLPSLSTPSLGYSDQTSEFDLSGNSILLPKELRPSKGRVDVPFVTSTSSEASTSTNPAYGINNMFLSGSSGLNNDDLLVQKMTAVYDPVNTTTNDFGNYTSLDQIGGGFASVSALVCRHYDQGGVKGIEIPSHYGIARLFTIYDQSEYYNKGPNSLFTQASDYRVDGGPDLTNYLREDGERRSLIITDNNTFVIPEDVFDKNKISGDIKDDSFVFEFSAFFYGDWDSDYVRLHQVSGGTLGSDFQMFVNGPAETSDDIYVTSTRVPYQGDVNGTMPESTTSSSTVSHEDYVTKRSPEDQQDIVDLQTSFSDKDAIRIENPSTLEILEVQPFATTLGTGVMSGRVEPGSYSDVGYLSMESYPFTTASDPNRHAKTLALQHPVSGQDITPPLSDDLAGVSERLPMGLILSDYQLLGEGMGSQQKRLWKPDISQDVPVEYHDDVRLSKNILEGAVTFSDGTAAGNNTLIGYDPSYNLYRTYRGGTVMDGSRSQGGGAVAFSGGRESKDFHYLDSSTNSDLQMHGAVLFGVALLVKTSKEEVTTNNYETNYGDELQLLVVSGLTLGQDLDLTGPFAKEIVDLLVEIHPRGIGEGYCAADRYRIPGRPLVKSNRKLPNSVTPYRGEDPS